MTIPKAPNEWSNNNNNNNNHYSTTWLDLTPYHSNSNNNILEQSERHKEVHDDGTTRTATTVVDEYEYKYEQYNEGKE